MTAEVGPLFLAAVLAATLEEYQDERLAEECAEAVLAELDRRGYVIAEKPRPATEPPDLSSLTPGWRFIRCACSHLVVSEDMTECRIAMDDHECPLLPDPPDEPEPVGVSFWRRGTLRGHIAMLALGMALGLLLGFVLLR